MSILPTSPLGLVLLRRDVAEYVFSETQSVAHENQWRAFSDAAATLLPPGTSGPAEWQWRAFFALQLAYEAIVRDHFLRAPQGVEASIAQLLTHLVTQTGQTSSDFKGVSHGWRRGDRLIELSDVLVIGALTQNPMLTVFSPFLSIAEMPIHDAMSAYRQACAQAGTASSHVDTFLCQLIDDLHGPALSAPHSTRAQIQHLLDRWAASLPAEVHGSLLLAADLAAEVETVRFDGPGPAMAPTFGVHGPEMGDGSAHEDTVWDLLPGKPGYVDAQAHFSPDSDWMPNLVLVAKQTFVWLAQLSKEYGRSIRRIDEIPDQALDSLVEHGFSGLWLIGLWTRSQASQAIKQKRGQLEAEASAYALTDYRIAPRLGGEAALDDLRQRATARGLRLCADMVPNHMGMDSRWMVEQPDWFIQRQQPPYPSYAFTGPNLSGDPRIEVRIEDGYWNESDAAVVFERKDVATGHTQYVYHGNDGTQMPWNDTAQLNYLDATVREAVIETVIEVARRFPVIRFDAAMTLARKHIQRLWYPPPGQGGAIPSRADNSVAQDIFDQEVPGEFWRELVDRVALEAPDTLLLAEAFWMMEGYFVRTLGMHRVYNSAFMHMLRDEENQKYRQSIQSVLQYSPAILERYVNFMNNPDEETAVVQFGQGDKYFGIATLLSTLPGLPMFGHGQIEGYHEKYGMEYARPQQDEWPDTGLVAHHERVIFPILRRRHLFSGAAHFALYDFKTEDGIDDNVYAFSNANDDGSARSLVVYNNCQESTAGWLQMASPVNQGGTDCPDLKTLTLSESMRLTDSHEIYYGFKALHDSRWILRSGRQLARAGLFFELHGYQALVFMEIVELPDQDGHWALAARHVADGWIPDLDGLYEFVHQSDRSLTNGQMEMTLSTHDDEFDDSLADDETIMEFHEDETSTAWDLDLDLESDPTSAEEDPESDGEAENVPHDSES